ncbi:MULTISPECIES: hypothetical protein [Streptomyces]|uniref:Uncharacterized protein n=2 Tax=Streptomyces TaxID=1883 RepID=A0A8H9HSQ6_9ACTN|nr:MULTISPECIES: hypothetical protein [Streptomyces]MDQ0293581.1 hypothetical protein [Streptomyces sp. DSM 41037]RPK86562.1 hypothetical protein EES47_20115 [Streptomyces sp. ADI98-12]WPR52963.1 hypothetical protein SJI45_19785 [Streptomyces sp. S399]WSU36003.1 hypothetical protein OG378_09430 [Streptomyces gougerotii]SUO94410.1 Uncharacterised protein [Streptomyces griseus]
MAKDEAPGPEQRLRAEAFAHDFRMCSPGSAFSEVDPVRQGD